MSSEMILAFHGGRCCGIKTIYNFGTDPYEKVSAFKATDNRNDDARYTTTSVTDNFFTDDAPVETRLERLDRYIAFVEKRRPQHLIEICLAEGVCINQTKKWDPLLKERGFSLVARFKNSNSGNWVCVYHLIIDTRAKKKSIEVQPDAVVGEE